MVSGLAQAIPPEFSARPSCHLRILKKRLQPSVMLPINSMLFRRRTTLPMTPLNEIF